MSGTIVSSIVPDWLIGFEAGTEVPEIDWLIIDWLDDWEKKMAEVRGTQVWVDTSGQVRDPMQGMTNTSEPQWYKSDEYMVCVRKEFVCFWVRKTSRRYDVQGEMQHEIAAFCAMVGDPFNDEAFRDYHRRADAIYFRSATTGYHTPVVEDVEEDQ